MIDFLVGIIMDMLSSMLGAGVSSIGRRIRESNGTDGYALVRRMLSRDITVASSAVATLRQRGWLEDCSLEKLELNGAALPGVDLSKVCLRHSSVNRADLHNANLQEANLSHATFFVTNLDGADLRLANLVQADLFRASVRGANLENAMLSECELCEADLSDAFLTGADLTKANMEKAKNLTDEQLCQAAALRNAIMPDGKLYDGRFNLPGDIKLAGALHFDTNAPVDMANFYGVESTSMYQRSQRWARRNLKQLRRAARLRKPRKREDDEQEPAVSAPATDRVQPAGVVASPGRGSAMAVLCMILGLCALAGSITVSVTVFVEQDFSDLTIPLCGSGFVLGAATLLCGALAGSALSKSAAVRGTEAYKPVLRAMILTAIGVGAGGLALVNLFIGMCVILSYA